MRKKRRPKGHWPAGKRRHPAPPRWAAVLAELAEIARGRRLRLLAHRVGVHEDTIRRWRRRVDLPAPATARKLVAELRTIWAD